MIIMIRTVRYELLNKILALTYHIPNQRKQVTLPLHYIAKHSKYKITQYVQNIQLIFQMKQHDSNKFCLANTKKYVIHQFHLHDSIVKTQRVLFLLIYSPNYSECVYLVGKELIEHTKKNPLVKIKSTRCVCLIFVVYSVIKYML